MTPRQHGWKWWQYFVIMIVLYAIAASLGFLIRPSGIHEPPPKPPETVDVRQGLPSAERATPAHTASVAK